MNEPSNSWEISYIILSKRPGKDLGLSYEVLFKKIGHDRARELHQWADENFTQRWFVDHI